MVSTLDSGETFWFTLILTLRSRWINPWRCTYSTACTIWLNICNTVHWSRSKLSRSHSRRLFFWHSCIWMYRYTFEVLFADFLILVVPWRGEWDDFSTVVVVSYLFDMAEQLGCELSNTIKESLRSPSVLRATFVIPELYLLGRLKRGEVEVILISERHSASELRYSSLRTNDNLIETDIQCYR